MEGAEEVIAGYMEARSAMKQSFARADRKPARNFDPPFNLAIERRQQCSSLEVEEQILAKNISRNILDIRKTFHFLSSLPISF